MPTIHLDLAFSPVLLALMVCVGFATAFWFYRFTVPVVSSRLRLLLALLRGTTIAGILFLLAQPLLRLTAGSTERPLLAILIDESESMGVEDGGVRRADRARMALQDPAFALISRRSDLRHFAFGASLRPIAGADDTAGRRSGGTDFSAALRELARERERTPFDAVLFLTDGIATTGRNPLHDAGIGVPLYAVALGDTAEPRDLSIVRITANRVVYAGLPTPVDILLRSSGLREGEWTEVVLTEGSKEIARQRVEPGRAAGERRITLTYVPEGSGTRRYGVSVDPLPGELTAANNRSAFVARVLRNRVRVLLVAGAPSPDVAVIGQTLREEKEYEVANLTQRADGAFVEGAVVPARLDSADVVVLVGYPGRGSGGPAWGMIRDALRSRPLPLMLLLGKGSDPAKLAELSPRVPFAFEAYGAAEEYLTPHPVERERLHPLLSVGGGDESAVWRRLPPLYRVTGRVRSQPGGTVLVEAGAAGRPERDPLVVLRNTGGDRAIGIAGYGLWRWRLMVQEDDAVRDFLGGFLSASMKWLTSPDDAKPFRVRQAREIVAAGEPIGLTAEAYDAAARPVDGVRVVATLLRPAGDLVTELRPLGNGRYEGEFDGLPEGEYRVTASGEVSGGVFGRDELRVIVGGASREMRDTRPDRNLLRSLAARTGGLVVGPDGLASLDSALSAQPGFVPRRVERSSEYRLQGLAAVLGVILCLLVAEWVLRRRAGML